MDADKREHQMAGMLFYAAQGYVEELASYGVHVQLCTSGANQYTVTGGETGDYHFSSLAEVTKFLRGWVERMKGGEHGAG